MAIYLVQHGLSKTKQDDPQKGLSGVGEAETLRIAEVAKQYDIPVAEIRHSGKKRALQTAEIFASGLKPERGLTEMAGIQPLDDVLPVADELDADSNVMVVGHLPFMERLVSCLTTGAWDKRVYKFQNSGIVCLGRDDIGWFIRWTLNPHIG